MPAETVEELDKEMRLKRRSLRNKRRREEKRRNKPKVYKPRKEKKVLVRDDPNRYKKKALIAAFSVCGVLTRACEVAGADKQQHFRWMKNDPKYCAAFEEARDAAVDGLELEARRRALEGTKRVVLFKGKPVYVPKDLKNPKGPKEIYVEHDYSDTLMMFLLKGQRPEKYRENAPKLEVNGNLQIKTLDGVNMDDL